MSSIRIRRLEALIKADRGDAAKVIRGDALVARIHQINQSMLAGAPDPLDGDAYFRERLHVEVATISNVDLDLVSGAPAMILRRRPDGTFPQKSNEGWTGLGQFSLDLQDIIDQLLKPGRGPVPEAWAIGLGQGSHWAWVGISTEETVVRAATPAWAMLEAVTLWFADLAASRMENEGKTVPDRPAAVRRA